MSNNSSSPTSPINNNSFATPLSQFELEREARIAKNVQRMKEMGLENLIGKHSSMFPPIATPTPRKKQKRKECIPESERRRTSRVVRKINYAEDRSILLGQEEEDAHRKRKEQQNQQRSQRSATRVCRRSVYSVGGRVYDSEKGTTCHWCRQKTVETHVECTGYECQNEAARPVQFCGMCLRNRHGEDIDLAVASGCWECPKCRKSCGDGCDNCCNCGPCRKKAGLAPTHQVIRIARENGFDNVHDYLVWAEMCSFSEFRVYPGHGIKYVRRDGQPTKFINAKCKNLYNNRKKGQVLHWTYVWRRLNKKGLNEGQARRRTKKVVRAPRTFAGVSLDELRARQNQSAKVRADARAAAVKEVKDRKKAAAKAKNNTGGRKGKALKNAPRGTTNKAGRTGARR